MRRTIASLLIIGTVAALAGATDQPRIVYRVQSYGAGYQPPPGMTGEQADALIRALAEHTAALKQLTAKPRQQRPSAPKSEDEDLPGYGPPAEQIGQPSKVGGGGDFGNDDQGDIARGVAMFRARCASCHDKSTMAKGDNYAFLYGDRLLISNFKQVWDIIEKTHYNEMPKAPRAPLTPEEFDIQMRCFSALVRQPNFEKR